MKKKTIKWKIFKYNLVVIITMIFFVAIIFNFVVRYYFEKELFEQLNRIAARTEDTVLQHGPNLMPPPHGRDPFGDPLNDDLFKFYFMLDRSLREPLSVLNADYILLDKNKKIIALFPEEYYANSYKIIDTITKQLSSLKTIFGSQSLHINISGSDYIYIVKPATGKDTFGLGWIIIYSSMQKINQLQSAINIILFAILILSALIIVMISSLISKKISEPFSSLNQQIRNIAERNFGTKINIAVDDELQEFVNNINLMSEKLETYDKAQKTFFTKCFTRIQNTLNVYSKLRRGD